MALPVQGKNRTGLILGILLTLVLVGIIFAGLIASGMFRTAAKPGPDTLKTAANTPEPTLQDTFVPPPGMPPEVSDWLEHLHQTEIKKEQLKADQMAAIAPFAQLLDTLGPEVGSWDEQAQDFQGDGRPPQDVTMDKLGDLRTGWRDIQAFFQSKPPPDECVPIAQAYDQALYEISGAMGDMMDLLRNMQSNPQAALSEALGAQFKSYARIDTNLDKTDSLVAAICAKYDVRKWFDIKSDSAGGSLGKFNVNPPVR